MNTSFDPLHLVNTYGAFGSVGQERNEIIFEGSDDAVITPESQWKAYEFKCKPGDPFRRPCVISPYHYRLDWQIWFAAMSGPDQYPWTLHLVWKLLHNDSGALSLLANNPFPNSATPPHSRGALSLSICALGRGQPSLVDAHSGGFLAACTIGARSFLLAIPGCLRLGCAHKRRKTIGLTDQLSPCALVILTSGSFFGRSGLQLGHLNDSHKNVSDSLMCRLTSSQPCGSSGCSLKVCGICRSVRTASSALRP